ncbi:MAG: DUF1499 domain-containing protein [Desulfosarcinaceae bacterium]
MKMIPKSFTVSLCLFLLGCTSGSASNPAVQTPAEKITLDPCPNTPNCVSSLNPTDKHYRPPLRYPGKKEFAYRQLIGIIESMPRALIAVKQANYIRVEFRSAFFKFVDDVEFLFSSNQPEIELRSASRVGYYDFGVNRRRMEDIRNKWEKAP